MITRGPHITLYPELTTLYSVHSSDAVIVYTGVSEISQADLGAVRAASSSPPPRYEDFNPDW